MKKKIGRFCWRTGLHSARILIVFAVLGMVGAGYFLWRVSQEPIDLAFAKDYIEGALYDEESGNHVVMDNVVLYWPDLQGPLYLQLENARLLSPQNDVIMSVHEAAMSFSRSALLLGKIRPKSIILKKPSLRITRKEDQSFDIGLGALSLPDPERLAQDGRRHCGAGRRRADPGDRRRGP